MKKTMLRALACLLALLTLALSLLSCSKKGKTLLTLDKNGTKVTLSVNTYELMLSRMKGSLCYYNYTINGVPASSSEFWSQLDRYNGEDLQTVDEYYRDTILDNCRTYLAALYLYEQAGLKLTATAREQVEDALDELLRTDGNGSKTKLNSVLAAYGVNYDMLEEIYLMEAKISQLQTHLYGENASKIGDTVKTEFMKEHYVHFYQIFLPTYSYVYETDVNGDIIYYYPEKDKSNHVYYDVYGTEVDDRNGDPVKDKNGDVIYYVAGSDYKKIAYNSADGEPAYKLDSKGEFVTKQMTESELAELKTRTEELKASLLGCTEEEFEAAIEKESQDVSDAKTYPDGYYLQKDLDYAASGEDYAYLGTIVEKLDTMQTGEIEMIKSPFGYHIIMKYDYTEKAYAKEENQTWFENFNKKLIESLFLQACRELYADITVDEKVLGTAPSMAEVGINYYY